MKRAPNDLLRRVLLVALFAGGAVGCSRPAPNDGPGAPPERLAGVPVSRPNGDPFPTSPKAGTECDIEVACGTRVRFCYVPAGECQLGSPKAERELVTFDTADETQEKRGTFRTKGFWLGKYEVTQAEWAAVMRGTEFETPSDFRIGGGRGPELGAVRDTSRFPVENVSWNDCQEFLKRANAHRISLGERGAFDLPHEDEWEYACRGGLGNQRPFYSGATHNGTQANCDGTDPFGTTPKGDYRKRPQAVGSYEAAARHPWGLCDVHGNVWEWCRNVYETAPDRRVLRGGSWNRSPHYCRAAYRDGYEVSARYCDSGLRLFFPDR